MALLSWAKLATGTVLVCQRGAAMPKGQSTGLWVHMDGRSVCSHYLWPCGWKKKSLHSSAVTASYLGVQRQQQVRNSSSNVGGDFYLQPVFEHVILKRHQITREDSMTPWGKKSSLAEFFHWFLRLKITSPALAFAPSKMVVWILFLQA